MIETFIVKNHIYSSVDQEFSNCEELIKLGAFFFNWYLS